MPVRINGWFGWRPDRPDHRDRVRLVARKKSLPESVDLREHLPPCYDQGDIGSCTANAIAAALEFNQRRQGQKNIFTPSRLFIYYGERAMEGTIRSDAGAEIRNGIKVVAHLGAPAESEWPYIEKKFTRKPTKPVFASAGNHQALTYARVQQTVQAMRECLAAGTPFVFGFTCYDSFEGDEVGKSGVLDLPKPGEKVVGGHAVLAVGYDMATGRVLVRNSWAPDWGQAGHFTMPFEYLTDRNLADDFWVIQTVE